MTKTTIDFQLVEETQKQIHNRLVNWAAWATPRNGHGAVSPMFRMYRSKAFQWHPPIYRETVDLLDAQLVEKTMRHLPHEFREALIWFYIIRCTPAIACRHLAVSYEGLALYLRDGRTMVKNLLLEAVKLGGNSSSGSSWQDAVANCKSEAASYASTDMHKAVMMDANCRQIEAATRPTPSTNATKIYGPNGQEK